MRSSIKWIRKRVYRAGRILLRWVPVDHTYSLSWVKAAIETKADVFTAHDLNTLRLAADAARATGAALIYDSHEYYMGRNKIYWDYTWPKNIRYHLMERRYIRRADAVITVSEGVADLLKRRYSIARPRLVRNVPDQAIVSNAPSLSDLIAQSGRDADGRFLMISVGRITAGRGIETTIESLRFLPANALAVFLGHGSDEIIGMYRQMAENAKVSDRVAFVGSVKPEEVVKVISGGHLGLVTVEAICESYKYALPNKLFESIHAGLPVVGSSLPCISQLIREHKFGFVFEEGNPRDLSEKILRLMNDEETRARFARHAAQAAKALCWEKEQKQLLDVYDQVLQGRQS